MVTNDNYKYISVFQDFLFFSSFAKVTFHEIIFFKQPQSNVKRVAKLIEQHRTTKDNNYNNCCGR